MKRQFTDEDIRDLEMIQQTKKLLASSTTRELCQRGKDLAKMLEWSEEKFWKHFSGVINEALKNDRGGAI